LSIAHDPPIQQFNVQRSNDETITVRLSIHHIRYWTHLEQEVFSITDDFSPIVDPVELLDPVQNSALLTTYEGGTKAPHSKEASGFKVRHSATKCLLFVILPYRKTFGLKIRHTRYLL